MVHSYKWPAKPQDPYGTHVIVPRPKHPMKSLAAELDCRSSFSIISSKQPWLTHYRQRLSIHLQSAVNIAGPSRWALIICPRESHRSAPALGALLEVLQVQKSVFARNTPALHLSRADELVVSIKRKKKKGGPGRRHLVNTDEDNIHRNKVDTVRCGWKDTGGANKKMESLGTLVECLCWKWGRADL